MLVIWKDTSRQEAMVFYDDDRRVSKVDGKTAQLAIDTWDRLKTDTYLTQFIHNPVFDGPWPDTPINQEFNNPNLIDHQKLMRESTE